MSFQVLVTSACFEPGFRGGGPVRSVARIVDTVSDDVEVTLVTRDRDLGAREPYPDLSGAWTRRGRALVHYLDTHSVGQWRHLLRQLRTTRFDLLYVNSLWSPTFTVLPIVAARLGLIRARRVLVAPRGELSPGALSLKGRKKRAFLWWWSRLLKTMDVRWHATSDREATDITAALPWAWVERCDNQTGLPLEPASPPAPTGGPARLVFVGRLSPKKNLLLALRALQHVDAPVAFDIYGPVEDRGYWAACQSEMASCPGLVEARYLGELVPEEVVPTFAGYDAFVFPTRGENFGHVIAESLAASCPVVCSDQTPWNDVLRAGGGAVLPSLTVEALAVELRRIAALSPDARHGARLAAADAYRRWRAATEERNVLDQLSKSRTDVAWCDV
jgi:glycosyltransferase involved in cell wall biosynthesis